MKFDNSPLYYVDSNLNGNRYSLFDLAKWKNGLAFKNIDFSQFPGVPVIKIAELNNGIGSTTAYTNGQYDKEVYLQYGDFLFSWSGNPQTSIDIFRFQLKEGWLNQHIFKVTPNESIVDKDFFFYMMKWLNPNFVEIATNKQTIGLGHVTISDLKRLSVIVPAKELQKSIGDLLNSIDNKIALNAAINENLEQQAKAIIKSWFVDFESFGGAVPNDWKLSELSEIATFDSGYSYKGNELQDSSIAMATIKNFDRNGGFKLDGYKEIIPSPKLKDTQYARLYDVLVAHTDLTQKAEVIGNAEIILNDADYDKIIFSMDLVKVSSKNSNISNFLLGAMLKTDTFKSHCLGYVNGTTVLHLSKKALPEYKLYLPQDLSELKMIDRFIASIYKSIAINMLENQRLAAIRDVLLPKLMTGEIDVSAVKI